MDQVVVKNMKLSKRLSDQITKYARREGSNFSQFMRTAAVERIRRMKKAA